MNWIDLIIIVPILFGLVRGLLRGFVQELTAIVAVIAGVVVAKLAAEATAQWLTTVVNFSLAVCKPIAYILLFLLTTLSLYLVAKLLTKLLKKISLGWLNYLLGGMFGALKWTLIVSVILNGVMFIDDNFHFINSQLISSSLLEEPIRSVAAIAWDEATK